MTNLAIPVLGTALILSLCTLAAPAALAGPLDLPGSCVMARAAIHDGGGGFEADRVDIGLAGRPDVSLHAQHLSADGKGVPLPPGVLAHASTAAAAGLLMAITGHHGAGCPDDVLRDAARPVADAVGHGGQASFTWTGLSIRNGSKRFGARRLTLHLGGNGDGPGRAAQLTASLDNAVSNDPAAALWPDAITLRASLPAGELPALISAANGQDHPVDLTIEHLDARRGPTTLDGQGHATLAADPVDSIADGHVTVRGYDALIDAAASSGLTKVRTALFLAKLVAHHQGDAAEWDLSWRQGTLTVNNVPLPVH